MAIRSMGDSIGRISMITRYIPLMLFLILMLSSLPIKSEYSPLSPGMYVEYTIRDGVVYKEILNVDPEVLVKHGIIHKYIIDETVLYTNIPKKKLSRMLEEGRVQLSGKISFWFSGDLYSKVKELESKNILPLTVGSHVISFRLTLFEIIEAKYSWRCLSIKDNIATIRASFIGKVKEPSTQAEIPINRTFIFLLELSSRRAHTLNGEIIGIVPYWTSISKVGENVLLYSMCGITINGTVHKECIIHTVLGTFNAYIIRAPATLRTPLLSYMAYDKDTGLLIKSKEYADPVLKHFMDISGIRTKYFEITKSNIVKGSSNTHTRNIVIPLIILSFFLTTVALLEFLRRHNTNHKLVRGSYLKT